MVAFQNPPLEIRLGNVESRIVGLVPRARLDRALNARSPAAAPVFEGPADRFLTGALPTVKRVLREGGFRFRIRDRRTTSRHAARYALSGPPLRPYQEAVVEAALSRGHGIVDIGTGGGKTLLAAAIIARLARPALYLVTTRTLLLQARATLATLLGTEPGVLGAGESDPRDLTVALVQSLEAGHHDLERWRGGTLVFDEGHHAAALTWQAVVRRIAPRHHYYLSAVPFRASGDQVVLDALAGARLTDGRYSAAYLIEKGYACPVEVEVLACPIRGDMRERPFQDLYRLFLVENDERNALIVRRVERARKEGRSTLVLVDRIRHGTLLQGRLGPGVSFVNGKTPRGVLAAETARFTRGEAPVLIATTGLFREGVSIDGIEVLVHAGGFKSRSKVLQAIGRGMRKAPGKDACTYVDVFDDDAAGVLRAHARERLRALKEEGFPVPPVPSPPRADPPPPVPPTWAHVPGTRFFARVDGEGRVHARGMCLAKALVPDKYCKRCRHDQVCGEGGITWIDPLD